MSQLDGSVSRSKDQVGPHTIEITRHEFPDDGMIIFVGFDFHGKKTYPYNGGCRLHSYSDAAEARQDCIELTFVMIEKHRVHKTGFSGSKIVGHILDETLFKKRVFIEKLANILNSFDGAMYTGCDVGMDQSDMEYLSTFSPFILSGLPQAIDTNLATSYGIVGSIRACLSRMNLDESQATVVLVGCGKVGSGVGNLLIKMGVRLFVSDLNQKIIRENLKPGYRILEENAWPNFPCDILVNCAFSKDLTLDIAHNLQCRAIISAANVPFENKRVEDLLEKRGITCVKSYISNGGAVISDSVEKYYPEKFKRGYQNHLFNFISDRIEQKTLEHLDGTDSELQDSQEEIVAGGLFNERQF